MEKFMVVSQKGYENYAREYGNKKAKEIESLILNSKFTSGLINNCRQNRKVPSVKDIGACVMSNMSMAFAKTATTRFACHILLDKWNWEINEELQLISDEDLIKIYHEINKNLH